MSSIEDRNFELLVNQLIENATTLFPTIIKGVKQSDERAKTQKVPWHKRHRLLVLIEVAEETKITYKNKVVVAPWFLAELKLIVEIGSRWSNKPIWKEIEPSLINSTHFTHTISKLVIVEHLERSGHKVQIVPRGTEASPDLMVQAIGGTQDWINVEVYQPNILSGGQDVSSRDIERIIKQTMKKAKKQLGRKTPGILAICGFNQKQSVISSLKESITLRLQKTDRLSLCGIALVVTGVLFSRHHGHISFTSIVHFDFVSNPNYFGRVEIDSSPRLDDTHLIKQPLKEISIQELVSNVKLNPKSTEAKTDMQRVKGLSIRCIKERLKIIEKPSANTRAIMFSKGNFPIIDGNGNIHFLCGKCQTILAKQVWRLSLVNIVTKCPSCGTYNEFSKEINIEIPLVGAIAIEKGEYPLNNTVHMKRGVSIIGR